jgi:stage II sporulation protein D
MVRPIVLLVAVLVVTLLIIPASVVQFLPKGVGQVNDENADLTVMPPSDQTPNLKIAVYRTGSKKIETLPIELYVRGVVASEMPSEFELEALKAQALAARTYIIRRIIEKDFTDTPKGSMVTDTEQHQVYHSEQELRKLWGIEYGRKISKINKAINETVGQVLTYEGKPITATFFSTSNGFTENSEEYWSAEIPYLRSVESPWDKESPRFKQRIEISMKDFQKKLNLSEAIPAASSGSSFSKMVSRTEGKRVKEVKIGNQIFSGKEIRELLGLASSHFEWEIKNGEVIVETVGYGHGVGMSQYGANGMAKEGRTAEEIVTHYYTGVEIQDFRQWIVKK